MRSTPAKSPASTLFCSRAALRSPTNSPASVNPPAASWISSAPPPCTVASKKLAAVRQALPDIARPIEDLNAVILQRSAEKNTVAVFALRRGLTFDPFLLQFAELATRPRSAEQILREVLQPGPAAAAGIHAYNDGATRAESEDHLALLARWFYARPRLGEIFFPDAKSDWPFRRILRACSRLLAPAPEHPA